MRLPGTLTTALAVTLLLSSCSSASSPVIRASATPSPTMSVPAFLEIGQQGADVLPDGVASRVDIAAESTRYQGDWGGREVFLGLKNNSSVCLIAGTANDPSSWEAGCGDGNEVVTWKSPSGDVVKYLPMTSSAIPEGWTRLSAHVFAM